MPSDDGLANDTWEQVDAYVQRFEAAWQNGDTPALDDFLPPAGPLRLDVLKELVHVDLERRGQAGKPGRFDEYLERYPELAADFQKGTAVHVMEPLASQVPPTPPFELGQYQIVAKIGHGGMGVVFRARHMRLKKPVAIKILPPDSMADPRSVARFQREMEAIGRLDHPNIVRATDAGEAGGVHFLVMELIDGIDLSRLIRLRGPLSVAQACELVRQAANGLQCAHEQGLVHRDVKPSNLLLSEKGVLKIVDLGLALLNKSGQASSVLTASGLVMGTADYMAPEQWGASHAVDIRADIYSLGCSLYTFLVGRPPFSGPDYGSALRKMAGHVQDPVKPIGDHRKDVPPAVDGLLKRMTAKDPGGRPGTPAEVAEALEGYGAGANLAAMAAHAMALNRTKAPEKKDCPMLASDAITGGRISTAGESVPTPLLRTGRRGPSRRALAIMGLVGFVAAIAVLLVRHWPGPSDGLPPAPGEVLPPETFLPGGTYDLLNRRPTQVVWSQQGGGSHWGYEPDQRLVWANCVGRGLLQLGTAPSARYDLEIEISQNPWVGGVGLFFRGREKGGETRHVRADVLLLGHFLENNRPVPIKFAVLDALPNNQKAYPKWGPYDVVAFPQPGKNRLKITVGANGLEELSWNGVASAPRVRAAAADFSACASAEGSFGIYMEDGNATIHSAHLYVHTFSGEQP